MLMAAVWIGLVGYAAVYAGLTTLNGFGKGAQPYSMFDALTSCPTPAQQGTGQQGQTIIPNQPGRICYIPGTMIPRPCIPVPGLGSV